MDMKQWLPPKARLHSAVRHRPVQAFVYRMPTGCLRKNWLAELRHILHPKPYDVWNSQLLFPSRISAQSFTLKARLCADGPTSPRSTQGGC